MKYQYKYFESQMLSIKNKCAVIVEFKIFVILLIQDACSVGFSTNVLCKIVHCHLIKVHYHRKVRGKDYLKLFIVLGRCSSVTVAIYEFINCMIYNLAKW